MLLRILAFLAFLFSVLFLPFWVSFILALAGMIYFNLFFEAILLFLLSDLLYGTKEGSRHFIYISFVLAVLIFIIIEIIKKKLRFYDHQNNKKEQIKK